jgi:hypothetical protein
MADYDMTDIATALAQNYRPRVIRTFNATSMALRTLQIIRGAGKNIAWDFEDSGAYAESFGDGDDVSVYGSDEPAPATLDWALYRANWRATNLAVSAAGSSASPADLIRLEARGMTNATRKLTSTLNKAFFNGLGTGRLMAGFDLALDDANTYAGVNRTSVAAMRAKIEDPGSATAPTFKLIRQDLYDIKDVCGELPDLAFVNSSGFLSLAAMFDDLRRFEQDITIQTARGAIVLDASVGKLQIEGCTFIADKDATAGKIDYINSNYVHIEYLPYPGTDQIITEEMVMADADDGYGPMPLGLNLMALARGGASRKFTMEAQLNLVVEKPNACGQRRHLAT